MLPHDAPHTAQGLDPDDPKVGGAESLAATRCSSTRFAVTAYYCGLEVADPNPGPDPDPGPGPNPNPNLNPNPNPNPDPNAKQVAHNLDRDASSGRGRVATRMGGHDVGDAAILSFVAWLQAMHAAGMVHGAHTRYVYRLGVSSEDGKAGCATCGTSGTSREPDPEPCP